MSDRRRSLNAARQSVDGWAFASLVALVGVALATEYLSRPIEGHSHRQTEAKGAETIAAMEADRGRQAETPSAIPVRGWKDVLLRLYNDISEHRILALAAGMTYYTLLAIFPAIAALVAIYGLFSDPSSIANHLDQLGGFLPDGAINVAREQLTRLSAKGAQALGLTFLVGLGVSLWSANAAMKSLVDTLNIVYGEQEKRGFVKLNAISLCFTICGVVFMLAALASIVVVPIILDYVGLSDVGDLLVRVGRWPAMLLVLTVALSIIYRYGPSREAAQWRWITWGSALAAVLWLGVSGLFSWYAASFGNFNQTYGSLGAVIGFMTWLWISAIVILVGGEVNAEMEHQTVRDTTTGPPRPMGKRGAYVADTVGSAQSDV
jgi:membrane protein